MTGSRDTGPSKDPDGGYGWVVAGAAFVSLAILNGIRCSFSLLYVEFSQVFDETKATLGWIGSLNIAMCYIIGLLAGKLVRQHGCRLVAISGSLIAAAGYLISAFVNSVPVLYVTYGIIAGSGLGIMMLPAYVLVQQYFTKRRALAAGLASLGLGLGNVAIPPAMGFFLQTYGWRGTLILSAGIALQGLIPASLYRPAPPRVSQASPKSRAYESEDARDIIDKLGIVGRLYHLWQGSVLRDTSFLLCAIGTFLMNFGMFNFITHSSSLASHYHIAPKDIMLLLPIIGACDALSRIFFSVIASCKCCNRILQYSMGIFFCGVVVLASSFTRTFLPLAILTGMFGIGTGCFLAIQQTVIGDLLGVERIAEAQGMLSMFIGVAILISIPFAGWLFDISQSYDLPLQVNGSLMTLGGVIAFAIVFLEFRKRKTSHHNHLTGQGAITGHIALESKNIPRLNQKFPIYRPHDLISSSTRSLNITLASELLTSRSKECLRKTHSANFYLANEKPWMGSCDEVNGDESRRSLIEKVVGEHNMTHKDACIEKETTRI